MEKSIDTLAEDIEHVILTGEGWTDEYEEKVGQDVSVLLSQRLQSNQDDRGTLRMSAMGTPCVRKLWYQKHCPTEREVLPANAKLKFLYGDVWEILLLYLAKAAGHDVRGCQDGLEICGIKGHRDAVIDGVTVDVKSASPYSFAKFKSGLQASEDSFGYLSQLSSYVKAGHAKDKSVHPTVGAFLVVEKVTGSLCLDVHSFGQTLAEIEQDFSITKRLVNSDITPVRGFDAVPDGYKNPKKGFVANGNMVLGVQCSYCNMKKKCWPELRTFIYGNKKPKFFTRVVKKPNIPEVD